MADYRSGLASLRSIADDAGYIPSGEWTSYLRGLTDEDREELRSSIFGESPTQVSLPEDPGLSLTREIYNAGNRFNMGYQTALGDTGLDENWIPGMNYASPYAPPEEYETVQRAYDLYMQGRGESAWDNPFSALYSISNPIGTLAKESGVSSGVQNALDIGYNLGSLGGNLATEGLAKATRSEGDLIENIGEGIDEALDPLEIDYYLREAGERMPESVRSAAPTAGSVIGGIVGSYVPIIGTAAGAAIGRGIGSKLEGEGYAEGLAKSGVAYAAGEIGENFGTLAKMTAKGLGDVSVSNLLSNEGRSGLSSLSSYLRGLRLGSADETADIIDSDVNDKGGFVSFAPSTTGSGIETTATGDRSGFYDDVLEELKRLRAKRGV